MKRLLTFLLAFLLMGCATSNLEKKADELEERIARAEMMAAAGSARANFWPARDVDWEGTGELGGDLDFIPSTGNQDAGFVSILGETFFGPTLNWFGVYVLDVDSNQTQDVPWIVDADDGGQEDWLLTDTLLNRIYSKTYVSPETAATVTVNDWDSGTYFANTDADVIEFDLPADPTDLVFCFGNGQTGGTVIDDAITIDPDASDYIIIDGATSVGAGFDIVSSGDGKDSICLAGLDSSYWKVTGYQGTWACNDCAEQGGAELYWTGDHSSGTLTACSVGDSEGTLGGGGGNRDITTDQNSTTTGCQTPAYALDITNAASSGDFNFDITAKDIFDSAQGCIDFWFYPDTSANERTILEAYKDAGDEFKVRHKSDGTFYIHHEDDTDDDASDDIVELVTTCTADDDEWTHMVIKWDTAGSYSGGAEMAASCDGGQTWEYESDPDDLEAFVSGEPTLFRFGCANACLTADSYYMDDMYLYTTADCT